ncbi:MAG TPA: methionine--tRNA ligase [Candidatus Dojkabacteria bacterium]|nr:methionine--tRNA ligase [Candidatus Dojkabacteria bacterium]
MENEVLKTEKILVAVSWPYANGNIHIGHLAGQNIAADVFARYHRLKGNKVLTVSGSDCHGAPIIVKAEELGITPAELAEQSHQKIVETYKKLGLLYENYTKTMTENHKVVVQNIFLVLKELGYLDIQESEQYYDPKVKRFLPDRYVKGTCPNCGATNARGDECPECGAYLNPTDLIDPYSTLSDAKPVLKKTEHFYLNLTKLQKQISTWVKANDKRWRKWVREFTRGWLKQGLEPRAVTRDLGFGVPVPVEGWESKVIYVWLEAVAGYLSASIEWAANQKVPAAWEEFWKDSEAKHYYFIAGGNVPFHTVMWPAELIAYNGKYNTDLEHDYKLPGETDKKILNLPYDVPANKMLFYKGKKMSKGDGTGITLEYVLERYSPDLLRFFFIRYAPENNDREYIWKDFIDANNNELVANLGNFINRVLTFTASKFGNKIPEGKLEQEVEEAIVNAFKQVGDSIENTKFIQSMEHILELGKFANKYFNDKKPWETLKTDADEAANTMYNSIQLVNAFRVLLKPYVPFSMAKLESYLNIKDEYDANKELEEKGYVSENKDTWTFKELEIGRKLNNSEILFEKLEYTDELKHFDEEV